MFKGFREFILRGNVADLAIAVVIGTAFTALVKAFVADILTPIIAAIAGRPNFADLTFTVNHSQFYYGDLINVAMTFGESVGNGRFIFSLSCRSTRWPSGGREAGLLPPQSSRPTSLSSPR